MLKKTIGILVLCFLCSTIAFAQSETQWEYLEVSPQTYTESYGVYKSNVSVRRYNYLNEGKSMFGEPTFERLGKAGWELVNAYSLENNTKNNTTSYIFKRRYIKARTDKEIEELEKWLKQEVAKIQPPKEFNLNDLDVFEEKQNLAAYNRSQEEKLRNVLEQIKDIPIQIINVESVSPNIGRTSAAAEIVVDATSILLKNGNNYRSSEAQEYLKQVVAKIINRDNSPLKWQSNVGSNIGNTNAKAISVGSTTPQKIGQLRLNNVNYISDGILLRISIIVNYKGQQNIVNQIQISDIRWNDEQNK